MPKDELVYVGHMLDKAHEALSLVRGKTRKDYDRDSALRLALTHLIQVIGEAARRVSSQFRESTRKFHGMPSQACGVRLCMIT